MQDSVRFGVIGTSWYADLWHLPIINGMPNGTITAICGRNGERAQKMADKYGIKQVYTDYCEMLDSSTMDAVLILSPDDQHYAMTMHALERGLHVICEKPMAVNVQQATEMHAKATAAGVKTMIYFTNRWIPVRRQVKRLVSDGYIGTCHHLRANNVASYGIGGHYAWRFDADRGLGTLGDFGSHMVDLARWYVGDISAISAHLATAVDRKKPDGSSFHQANDTADLLLEFKNGATGSVHVSSVANMAKDGQITQVTLYGDEGTIEASMSMAGDTVFRGAKKGADSYESLSIDEDLLGRLDSQAISMEQNMKLLQSERIGARMFADAILEDTDVEPNFFDGLENQKVLNAAVKSHNEGIRVAL